MKNRKRKKLVRRNDVQRLLAAVTVYLEKKGAKIAMCGPVHVMNWPGGPDYKYSLKIDVIGTRPPPPPTLISPAPHKGILRKLIVPTD